VHGHNRFVWLLVFTSSIPVLTLTSLEDVNTENTNLIEGLVCVVCLDVLDCSAHVHALGHFCQTLRVYCLAKE
jgi:hypothetical protein